jgi:predicted secreted protein
LRSSLISREMRRLKVSSDFNTGFRSLHAAYTITMYNVG